MTDERLAELKADRDKAIAERTETKNVIDKDLADAEAAASTVRRLNDKRKTQTGPKWQALTTKVADLTAEIQTEENRRAEEAAKAAAETEAQLEPTE